MRALNQALLLVLLIISSGFAQYGKRISVVLMPFEVVSCANAQLDWVSGGFHHILETRFYKYRNQIRVVDRARIEHHIREQQLVQAGFTIDEQSVKTGKFFSANYSIYGKVICLSDTLVLVNVNIVDVQSTEKISDELYGNVSNLYKNLPDSIVNHVYFKLLQMYHSPTKERENLQADYSQLSEIPDSELTSQPLTEDLQIQLFSVKSMTALSRFYSSVRYMQQNNWVNAELELKRATELDPDFAQAYVNLGVVYMNQGKYSQARQNLEKALSIYPDCEYAYYNLGLLYSNINDFLLALQHFERALQINPDNCEILNEIGKVHYKTQKFYLAKEIFNKILAVDSSFVSAHLFLGLIAARTEGNLMSAEKHWLKVIKSQESYFAEDKKKAFTNLGNLYFNVKDYKKAARYYEEEKNLFINLMDKEEYLNLNYLLAFTYLADKEPIKGLPLLSENVKEKPGDIRYQYYYALALYQTKNYDNAIVHFEAVCEIDSNSKFCKNASGYLKKLRGY